MDIFMKCQEFTKADDVKEAGLYPYFIPLTNNEGTEALIGDHHLIMIGSNNYLGLTVHPKIRKAAQDAIGVFGTSCTGSRFLNGTLEMHLELERLMLAYLTYVLEQRLQSVAFLKRLRRESIEPGDKD